MKNIIIKSATITIASLLILVGVVFSLWLVTAPGSMAHMCEQTGNFKFAVTCASLDYKYYGGTDRLMRCVNDSLISEDDKLIAEYGEKLLNDEHFGEVCDEMDKIFTDLGNELNQSGLNKIFIPDYKIYICSIIAASKYRCGDLDGAIAIAERAGDIHGYVSLTLAVKKKQGNINDKIKLKEKLQSISAEGAGTTLGELISLL